MSADIGRVETEPNFAIKRIEHSGYVYWKDPCRYVVYVPPPSEPSLYLRRLGMHCYEMSHYQYTAYSGSKYAIHVFVLQMPLIRLKHMPPLVLYLHPMECITCERGAMIMRLERQRIAEAVNDERYNFVTFSLLCVQ